VWYYRQCQSAATSEVVKAPLSGIVSGTVTNLCATFNSVIIAIEPGVLCAGYSSLCPLDEFIKLTSINIPTDWQAECNSTKAKTS